MNEDEQANTIDIKHKIKNDNVNIYIIVDIYLY